MKLAQLLTLLVHEYFDRELVDQANALKVLTVLCALPNLTDAIGRCN